MPWSPGPTVPPSTSMEVALRARAAGVVTKGTDGLFESDTGAPQPVDVFQGICFRSPCSETAKTSNVLAVREISVGGTANNVPSRLGIPAHPDGEPLFMIHCRYRLSSSPSTAI